jgi:intracellular septation protein A
VDTSADAPQAAGRAGTKSGRLLAVAMIAIFDVAAPLAAYGALRSAGWSAVAALLLSGVFPVLGVTIAAIRNRRLDVVGALVLAGIVVGTVLGVAFHSARLLLIEGSVPTAMFGFVCLGSLRAGRPLLFSVVLEFTGPDTARGREMTSLWKFEEYRRIFRIITAVWGIGFLVEAALRVVIVENTSTGTALASSKVMPFVFAAALSAWTVGYGTHQKKNGERMAAAGQTPGPGSGAPAAPQITRAPDPT